MALRGGCSVTQRPTVPAPGYRPLFVCTYTRQYASVNATVHDGHVLSSDINTYATRTPGTHTALRSDLLYYAALALLPVDGLRFGLPMPYWNPISPLLFAAYALCHWGTLLRMLRRHRLWLIATAWVFGISLYGWLTVAFHPLPALITFVSIALGFFFLASLIIAVDVRKLPISSMVTVLVVAYWCAFAVGVIEFISIKAHFNGLHTMFMGMMQHNYVAARPQFLFAEPSYIGMHLFGVLLPVYWLTRRRALAVLITCFAIGSMMMNAGTRIVIDTMVAALACLIIMVPWRRIDATTLLYGLGSTMIVFATATIAAVAVNPRLRSIWEHGFWNGDVSASARLFRTLSPLLAGIHDPSHLFLGFGAGNLGEAMRRGFPYAGAWVKSQHGIMTNEMLSLGRVRDLSAFSMNVYTSVIAEFGIITLVLMVTAVLAHVTRNRQWNLTTVVWLLLLAYLYCQYEAYAFYAFWLFLAATGRPVASLGKNRDPGTNPRYTLVLKRERW